MYQQSKKKIILKCILWGICIVVIAFVFGTAVSIWKYGKVDEKRTADVAIVLGAGTGNDEVTPVFRERLNHGIWIYENGYVDKIILTGGYGKGNVHSDAYVARMYVVANGIPESDILLEEESTITQENIKNAKTIMDDRSYDTAVLVSDPLHMKRAMQMAADYGIEAYSSPTPTTMYRSIKNKILFLAREVFFYIGYQIVK